MATRESTKDLGHHSRHDADPQNEHFPKQFRPANNATYLIKDPTGNIDYPDIPRLPPALDFVDAMSTPPTENNGDIYILNLGIGSFDVDTIVWQSGTTVRYTFNDTPDLSPVSVGDTLEVKTSTNESNDGIFTITDVNDGLDFIEVTNEDRTDGTDDEASDSPSTAFPAHRDWDGAPQLSYVKFDEVAGVWEFVQVPISTEAFDLTANEFRRFNGTDWALLTSVTGGGIADHMTFFDTASTIKQSDWKYDQISRALYPNTTGNDFGKVANRIGDIFSEGPIEFKTSIINNVLEDASSNILLEINRFSENDWGFTTDLGAYVTGNLYVADDNFQLVSGKGGIIGGATDVTVKLDIGGGSQAGISLSDNSAGDVIISSFTGLAVFINASTAKMNSGITGSVIVGGVGVVGDKDNFLFVQNLEVQGGVSIFDVTNIEALLVRKAGDTGDVLIVDTTNSRMRFNGHAAFGNAAPSVSCVIISNETATSQSLIEGLNINVTNSNAGVAVATGVIVLAESTGATPFVKAGDFIAKVNSSSNVVANGWIAIQTKLTTGSGQSGTIAEGITHRVSTPSHGTATRATSMYGIQIENQGFSANTNVYGIKIENQTAGANVFPIHQSGTNGTNIFNAPNIMASLTLNSGRLRQSQGADKASANDLVLGSDGNVFEITGTTQINRIVNTNWQNGSRITLLFTSTPTVKHGQASAGVNVTILLSGSLDFSATAGDTLSLVLSEIGGTQAWRETARTAI